MNTSKIEQNKNSSVTFPYYRLSLIAFVIVFFISCFCFYVSPVFADSSSDSLPVLVMDSTNYTSGRLIYDHSDSRYDVYISSSSDSTYCFTVGSSYNVVFCSSSSGVVGYLRNPQGTILNLNLSNYYDDTFIAMYHSSQLGVTWSSGFDLLHFDTLADGISYFYNSSSSSASVVPVSSSYLEYDTSSYVKSTVSDTSALAYWSPDGGTTLRAIVGTIDANTVIYRYTDTSSSGIPVFPFPSIGEDFYGNTFSIVSSDYLDIGYFDSAESALTAIYNYLIDSGSTPVPASGKNFNIDLPGGYVLIADINGIANAPLSLYGSIGQDMTLSQINSSTYVSVGQPSTPLTAPFSLPISGTSRIISWTGDNPSVLGTYFHVRYTDVFYSSNGGYVVIVNPYLTGDSEQAGTNGLDLQVSIFANNAVIYSLQGTLSYVDGEWSQSDVSTDEQYIVTVDSETGETVLTTANGDPIDALKYGGSNSTFADDLGSTTRNFISWLQKTLKAIGGALEAGKSAIMTLVGYASGFFGVISSIYAWLPAPVYSVLTSAIILVITIGIIKVFI